MKTQFMEQSARLHQTLKVFDFGEVSTKLEKRSRNINCWSALRLRSGSLEGVPSNVEGNLTPTPIIYLPSGVGKLVWGFNSPANNKPRAH